jgi:hypothetical protein
MSRFNKTLRRKRQRRQRSRRLRFHRRQTFKPFLKRLKGGNLPVPAGSLVGVSLGGEYGVPILLPKEVYEREKEREGLED